MTFVKSGAGNAHNLPRIPVCIVPLKQIEYGLYGDLIMIYPKPYSNQMDKIVKHEINGNWVYTRVMYLVTVVF